MLCSGIHRSEFQGIVLFVYLLLVEIIISMPVADNQTFSVVISKVQNEQRILLFVHGKLV